MAGQLAILDLGRAHMDAQQILISPRRPLSLERGQRLAWAMRRQDTSSFLSSPLGWA